MIQEQKFQVELKDLSLDMALISVQGPKRQVPSPASGGQCFYVQASGTATIFFFFF